MTAGLLRITFDDCSDGTGEFVVHAVAGNVSGTGKARLWVNKIEKFADRIASFAISNEPHSLILRQNPDAENRSNDGDATLLEFRTDPIDARGNITVGMSIMESGRQVRIELNTTHKPLERFARDLIAVVHGNRREAVLGSCR